LEKMLFRKSSPHCEDLIYKVYEVVLGEDAFQGLVGSKHQIDVLIYSGIDITKT